MIISLHMPKTAGTSFGATLEEHFGTRILKVYDRPLHTPQYQRNETALQESLLNAENDFAGIECIHGHFLPIKYLLLASKREIRFVTWMRNPVERILSHYFFWMRGCDPKKVPGLHRKAIEENWSIERFCLGPEIRDLYGQFLWGFPVEYFDFIGITEYYDDDFAYFSQHYLGAAFKAKKKNVGDRKRKGGYQIDASLRKKIEAYHAKDLDLYKRALEKRLTRHAT